MKKTKQFDIIEYLLGKRTFLIKEKRKENVIILN